MSPAHLQAQVEEELSPSHLQAQVEEELSPTHFKTYLTISLNTELKKLPTISLNTELKKLPTISPNTNPYSQLKKLPTITSHTKKFPITINMYKQLKKLPCTNPLTQLKQQLRAFLLSHIYPRRFFSQLLLPSKCLLFGQLITNRRMFIHLHIFKYSLTMLYPILLS